MTSTKIEFDVQMSCNKCEEAIKKSLSGVNGINDIQISLEKGSVVVDTCLPHLTVQEKIESTGRKAVLKGYGEASVSAVSMLGGNSGYSSGDSVKGVVRFVQTNEGTIIDGTVDGLTKGDHGLHIHECGDISKGCESVGDHYNPFSTQHGAPSESRLFRHVGDLGNVTADDSGRATFRTVDKLIDVQDIIGRSLVITEMPDDYGKSDNPLSKIDGNSGRRLACGIIARSSGLFQNSKKICACDGLTLWDERDKTTRNTGVCTIN